MKTLLGPRQTIFVTTRGKHTVYGKEKQIDNIIPVDWHMPCSIDNFLYAIAIKKTNLSYHLILKSQVFVVNFIPMEMKDAVLFCGMHSGLHMDKFKEAKLFKLNATTIDCCKVSGALGYLECHVQQIIECDDHVIFLAKVIHKELKGEHKRLFHYYDNLFVTTDETL